MFLDSFVLVAALVSQCGSRDCLNTVPLAVQHFVNDFVIGLIASKRTSFNQMVKNNTLDTCSEPPTPAIPQDPPPLPRKQGTVVVHSASRRSTNVLAFIGATGWPKIHWFFHQRRNPAARSPSHTRRRNVEIVTSRREGKIPSESSFFPEESIHHVGRLASQIPIPRLLMLSGISGTNTGDNCLIPSHARQRLPTKFTRLDAKPVSETSPSECRWIRKLARACDVFHRSVAVRGD